MTAPSATYSVQVAYVDALNADSALAALIVAKRAFLEYDVQDQGKKYVRDDIAPVGFPSEFIYIASGTESASTAASFGDAGAGGIDTLHIWSRVSQLAVRQIFCEVRRVLESVAFSLSGHAYLSGDCTLIGTLAQVDPDDHVTRYRGIVQYRWQVVTT